MRLIDLTGKRFGRLTVICRDFETQKLKKMQKSHIGNVNVIAEKKYLYQENL